MAYFLKKGTFSEFGLIPVRFYRDCTALEFGTRGPLLRLNASLLLFIWGSVCVWGFARSVIDPER